MRIFRPFLLLSSDLIYMWINRFRTAEVALMMDWEDSGSSGSDDEDVRALSKVKENMKRALSRGSMV
jgi:hypothetical protein